MSTLRFLHQNEVIIIAGAGDWWACRVYSREEAGREGVFSREEYGSNSSDIEAALEGDIESDELVDPSELATRQSQQQDEARREEQLRTARAEGRAEAKARKQIAELTQGTTATIFGQNTDYPWNEVTLNAYGKLKYPQKTLPLVGDDTHSTTVLPVTWSPYLRLGTKASDR
jgi:hypothetical protein